MTHYQKVLHDIAPDLDPLHMESLALAVGSTLNGMPKEFFADVANLARRMGAEKLAALHAGMTARGVDLLDDGAHSYAP